LTRFRTAAAILAAAFAAALVPSSPASAAPGYVSRSGTALVGPTGAPLKLNGVNLGGYLLWEGWILGGGMDAETPMYTNLAALVGPDRAARFRSDLRAGFITAADFTAMRSMGFNTVRIPFNHRLLANDANGGFATLDRLLAQAERAGVSVVLDMHAIPGAQSFGFIADPAGWPDVWSDPVAQEQTVQLWKRIAARYANRAVVAGYDLINEPWAPNPAALMSLYGRIIAGIRSVDRNHLVIIEGNQLAHDFTGFSRIDENLAYSFHMYPFDGGDLDAKLSGWIAAAQAAGVPLWNGEYGQSDLAGLTVQAKRFAARPELDGQSLWTWKIADRNRIWGFPLWTYPAPVKFTASDAWLAIAAFMASPSTAPRPSATAAEAGLQSFTSAIAPGAVRTDTQVATALAAVARYPTTTTALRTSAPATSTGTGTGTEALGRADRKARKHRRKPVRRGPGHRGRPSPATGR
jgi:hypothetical protein